MDGINDRSVLISMKRSIDDVPTPTMTTSTITQCDPNQHISQVPTDDMDSIFDVVNISDGDLYLGTEGVSKSEEVMVVSSSDETIVRQFVSAPPLL